MVPHEHEVRQWLEELASRYSVPLQRLRVRRDVEASDAPPGSYHGRDYSSGSVRTAREERTIVLDHKGRVLITLADADPVSWKERVEAAIGKLYPRKTEIPR